MVSIKYGYVILSKVEDLPEPRKRLVYRGKTNIMTETSYFIKMYELDYGGKEEIQILASSKEQKFEVYTDPETIINILKIKKPEMLYVKLELILDHLYIHEGKLAISHYSI